jgi:guanylate kinase
MNKRIILCGPAAGGKNFIRQKFVEKGYKADCSYTSREPRPGEVEGVDYKFITKADFRRRIEQNAFYEYVEYGDNLYGTGKSEWNNCDIFIMETDGIKHINEWDRKHCLVIYVNTPYDVRLKRMREREWDGKKIKDRVQVDMDKFGHSYLDCFKDFDIEISSQEFGKGLPHFR